MQRCAASYYDEFEKPKIILPDISLRGNYALDAEGKSFLANTAYLIGSEEKYLLGVLCSNLIHYFYASISTGIRGGYLRFINQYLAQIPIANSTEEEKETITHLVNQILALKAEDPAADTSALEREIDQRVYQLYDLTPEEIALVEQG